MAITASVQPESGRIVYAGPDFPHPFQLRFSKEGMDHIAQNRSESDLDGLVRVWPNTPGLEASRCAGIIWPVFWQVATRPASSFSTFRLGSVLPQTSRIILCRTSPDPIWLIVSGFLSNGSGPEASRCQCKNHQAGIWPTLPSRSRPDANRIRKQINMVLNVHRNHTAY